MDSSVKKDVLVLLSTLLVKPDGAVIMNTEQHKIGLGIAGVVVFGEEGKKTLAWDEVSDGLLWEIYDFISVAVKMKPETVESFVALGSAEDKSWYMEPVDLMDALGRTVLGKVGVAQVDDSEQMAVIFISPDGSWSTLTMYRTNFPNEVATARGDVKDIGLALLQFSDKL